MNVVLAYGIESAPAARGHVVVIDVLRAFTCAAFAFDRGAESIVLVSTADEAFAIRRTRPDVLLIGHGAGGRIIPGFDFGNSPHDLVHSGDRLRGRTLVQRTGSGTQVVVAAKNADAIYLGSLPVASATCRHLRHIGAETATLLASGSSSGLDSQEDLACRAFMADALCGRAPDRDATIRAVRTSPGGVLALDPSVDWTVPGDLDCATAVDEFDFAMPVTREDGLLVARRFDVPHPARWDGRWPADVATMIAKRQLGELRSDGMSADAESLIAAGFVTDELCALVGSRDAGGSVDQERFERSIAALGLTLDLPTAVVVLSLDSARRIVAGSVAPKVGAYEVGRFWSERREFLPTGYAADWREFYAEWSEYDFDWTDPAERDARRADIDASVRNLAQRFLRRYGG